MEEPTPNNEDERLRRLEESLLAAEERSRQREERDRQDREERRKAMEALNAHTGGSVPPPPVTPPLTPPGTPPPTPPGPPATPPPPPTPPPHRPGFFNRKRLRTAALAAGLATIGGGGYEVGKKLKWWGKSGTEISSSEKGGKKENEKAQKAQAERNQAQVEALKKRSTEQRESDSPVASKIARAIGLNDITAFLSDVINDSNIGLGKIVNAIIANEGHSPAGVKNNPGNIKYYKLSGQTDSGVKASDGGTFASYATEQDGKDAILGLVEGAANRGYTFEEFINGYTNTGRVRFNRTSAPPPARPGAIQSPVLPPMPFELPAPEPEPEKQVPPSSTVTQPPVTVPDTTRETRAPQATRAPKPPVVFVSPFKNRPSEETKPAQTAPAPEIPDYKPDANRPILRHTPDRKVETIPGPPPLPPVRGVDEAKKRVYESYGRSGETVTSRGEGGDNVIYNSNPGGVGLGGGRPPLGISPREILILQTHPEFAKNPFRLTPERLIQVYQMHQRNIALIFQHHDDGMNAWMDIKDLKGSAVFNAKNTNPKDRLYTYVQKLYKVTGLKPQDKMFGRSETVNEYLARALQKAASLGKLTEMKEE